MELDETAHILGSADFFAICTLEQRRMLAFASEQVFFEAGKTLFVAGEVISGAYVLISGELISTKLSKRVEKPVFIDAPGTVIGELALIAKHPRRATITCKTDAKLLYVPRSAFAKLMQQFPDVAVRAMAFIQDDISKYVGSLKQVRLSPAKKY
ncbi:MAG TPA: cyclic nucleotide-binding domain-containing protein [Devosia sp.]|nr:cyclic nucleotide-binding domain-containing protein [Devosia sp.]